MKKMAMVSITMVLLGLTAKMLLSSDDSTSLSRSSSKPKDPLSPWPYTERNQPTVYEVLERAANLTHVAGRPIKVQVLHENPKILMIDDFLTDDHCELMIKLAKEQGLERSTTTGEMGADGKFHRPVDDSRTSSNSWCFNTCFSNPIVNEVDKLIEYITLRPKKNMEHYQLLHYESSQEYREHHDYIHDQALMSQGPRQMTFFLYLNDVPEGGETHFMKLGIKVKPKKGRAVLWPNIYFDKDGKNENNKRMHPATFHAALPVIKGEKYGANKWIHKGDFLGPWSSGVSG